MMLILASAACILLSSCTKEIDCIYQISRTTESSHSQGKIDGPAYKIHKAYLDELKAFDEKYQSSMLWSVTVKNDRIGGYDNDADARFQAFKAELQTIVDKYSGQLEECVDLQYSFRHTFILKLTRNYTDGEKTLEQESFSLSYRE